MGIVRNRCKIDIDEERKCFYLLQRSDAINRAKKSLALVREARKQMMCAKVVQLKFDCFFFVNLFDRCMSAYLKWLGHTNKVEDLVQLVMKQTVEIIKIDSRCGASYEHCFAPSKEDKEKKTSS